MSYNSYSEYTPDDSEIDNYLDEIYPDDVQVCGYYFSQSYILREMDRIAYDMFANDNMCWYKCDICGTIHKSDNAEDEARECCQEYCTECNTPLDDGEGGLCEDCQLEEDEGEDTDDE